MRTYHKLALAIALSLITSSVYAAGQERPGADQRYCKKHLQANKENLRADFQTLDRNHDGRLTKKESGRANAARICFDKLDRNHDHQLSADELARS